MWQQRVINELKSTAGWILFWIVKLFSTAFLFISSVVISVIASIYLIYYMYTLYVCQNMCMLPLVCRFCPNPALGSTALSEVYIPPINIVAEKTARLVEDLTNTDLDATDRFRAIQVVLTRIQSRVNIINIDKRVKEQLKTDLPALDHLIEKGIDDFIEMQAVLGSGVDSLKKHTEYVLDDFLRILDGKNSLFGPERIGK